MSVKSKQYLGDSVYIAFDGFTFTLTTEDGVEVSNKIILEPEVADAVVNYIDRIKASCSTSKHD